MINTKNIEAKLNELRQIINKTEALEVESKEDKFKYLLEIIGQFLIDNEKYFKNKEFLKIALEIISKSIDKTFDSSLINTYKDIISTLDLKE